MKKWVVFFGFVLCFTSLISGKIIFYSDYEDSFSVGDILNVNVSISPVESGKGYFDFYLNCNEDDLLVHREYSNFASNVVYWADFSFPVSLKGDCYLEAFFRDESQKSDSFIISNNISINYVLNRLVFSPGETVIINGTAMKGNDEWLNGVVELEISNFVQKTIDVSTGNFYYSFLIPNDAPPGKYDISLYAYNEDSDGVLNSGKVFGSIEILSKPAFLDIFSEEVVTPPSNFSMRFSLFDQGKNLMLNKTLQVKLVDSSLNAVFDEVILNNETIYYFFDSDALVDTWNIYVYHGNLFSSRPIYVGANSQIIFDYVSNEGKLRVENVGNIKYENVIYYTIIEGNVSKNVPLNINLSVGESKLYHLISGSYNLSIGEKVWENVEITGAAIFSEINISKKSYIVSFLIILFIVFLFVFIRNRKKIFSIFLSQEEKILRREEKIKIIKKEKAKCRKIYSIFLNLDSSNQKIEDFFDENKINFRKFSDKDYFYVFISSNPGKENELFSFAKALQKLDSNVSVLIYSKIFDGKANSLKNFALVGKRLFSYVQRRGIVLSQTVFDALGMSGANFREFKIGEEVVKVAFLK